MRRFTIIFSILLIFSILPTKAQNFAGQAARAAQNGNIAEAITLYAQAVANGQNVNLDQINQVFDQYGETLKNIKSQARQINQFIDYHNKSMFRFAIIQQLKKLQIHNFENLSDYYPYIHYLDFSALGITDVDDEIKELNFLDSINLTNNPYLTQKAIEKLKSYLPTTKIILNSQLSQLPQPDYQKMKQLHAKLDSIIQAETNQNLKYQLTAILNLCEQQKYSTGLKNSFALAQNYKSAKIFNLYLSQLAVLKLQAEQTNLNNLKTIENNIKLSIFKKAADIPYTANVIFSAVRKLNFEDFGINWLPYQYIKRCKSLRYINIIGNKLKDYGQFYQAVNGINSLQDIYISIFDGQINIPAYLTDKITGIRFEGKKLDQVPDKLFMFKNLKYLQISRNNLTNLPQQFEIFQKLQYLDASYNKIKSIDFSLSLPMLQTLNLAHNQLSSLPPGISQDLTLENLNLAYNKFTQFPVQILDLQNLQTLILKHNQIPQIPERIGRLFRLNVLDLSYNKIQQLPNSLFELRKLDSLSLKANKLTQLPPLILQLQDLQDLDISLNRLTSLPQELFKIKRLRRLDISWNLLDKLSPQIGQLNNLVSLRLAGNKISSLPKQIGKLQDLEALYVNNNNLTDLPEELYKLKNLRILNISWNHISQLSPSIEKLQNLIALYAEANQLKTLPPETGKIKTLRVLMLNNNQITSLPGQLGDCPLLSVIALNNNQLRKLPESIGSLDLLILQLSNNKLTQLPKSMTGIKTLITVDLSYNNFTEFPMQIITSKNIFYLDLSYNKIKTIPPQISEIEELITLNLANNQITTLPASIAKLKNLEKLVLSGNPIPQQELQKIRNMLPKVNIIY